MQSLASTQDHLLTSETNAIPFRHTAIKINPFCVNIMIYMLSYL
jgi:hypothetical protein